MIIPLRQSTASQIIPLGHFLNTTDANSELTSLTIANTDIKVHKAGATSLVSKNSGGATHMSNGVYYTTLDATDTSAVGALTIYVHVATSLVVVARCQVFTATVYDALYASAATGYLQPTVPGRTLDVSATGEAGVDWANVGGQGTTVNLSATTTNLVNTATTYTGNTPQTGDSFARIGATGSGLTSLASATNLATLAGYVDTEVAAIKAQTDLLPASPASTTNITTVGAVSGAVGSVTAGVTVTTNNDKTGYSLSSAGVQAIWDAATTLLTTVGSIGKKLVDSVTQTGDSYARLGAPVGASHSADVAAVKTDTAAIKAKTDNLPASPASTTNITAGTITTVTNLTNAPTVGDLTATMKASVTTAATASTPVAASVTGAVGSVTAGVTVTTNNDKTGYSLSSIAIQAIWDALTSALTTVGSIGKKLVDSVTQTGDSYVRIGATGSGLTSLASATNLATLTGYVDTEVAAIKAVTDKLDTTLEFSGAAYRFTTLSLALAPSGTGASAASIVAAMFTSNSGETYATSVAGSPVYEIVQNAGGGTGLDAAGIRAALGMATANLDTQLADLPTGAEFTARTLAAASYATPTNITAGTITNVGTVTNLTNAPTNGDFTTTMKTSITTAATASTPSVTVSDKTGFTIAGTLTTLDGLNTAQNTQHSTTQSSLSTLNTTANNILTDTAEIGVAGAGLTNINLPNQTMDIIGNITGDLSGSVGSVTNRVTANVDQIAANATAATNLSKSTLGIASGTAITGTLTNTQMTTNLTETTDGHYIGGVIVWTSGVLAQQKSDITAYDGTTKKLTFTATTDAPANGDTWVIV